MAKRRPPTVHGLVLIDKPAGMTSHDVVSKLRKLFNERRIGHAGTLDPDATGVMVVGVGYVTRLMQFLSGMNKTYTCEVVFGSETNTLDDSGTVTATYAMSDLSLDVVREAAAKLTGQIMQVPPMVSALKVDGKRLHELAREGIEVERKPRPVTVYAFEVHSVHIENGIMIASIEVRCSSGTYVRTLAADLGTLLGGGAHLRNLRRTTVGDFTLADCTSIEDAKLLQPIAALRSMTRVVVDTDAAAKVRHGRSFPAWPGKAPWAVVDEAGALLAVYEQDGPNAKPSVVLAEAIA
ncbi:MAG: tRNA pseudouridine(55) synthase TruB [Actinobacteria bacterium]|nr:tRNA pseudouridine(55) synthase TruB [Actinomycetota bacterium]